MLISGSPIDAYFRIDSYTTIEKLIADYILQDSTTAIFIGQQVYEGIAVQNNIKIWTLQIVMLNVTSKRIGV